jgi:hypothetical protein
MVVNARLRAERKKERICSEIEYRKSFERLRRLPRTAEHLIVQLGTLLLPAPTVVTISKHLGQGFPSRTPGWFSWRVYSTQSLIL